MIGSLKRIAGFAEHVYIVHDMRFLLSIVCIAIVSYITEYCFNAWWMVAIVCFLAGVVLPQKPGKSFWAGFIAIFLLWMIVSLIADARNAHILAPKMAKLFHLPGSFLFMVIASLIGALVGGLGAWSGAVVRNSK